MKDFQKKLIEKDLEEIIRISELEKCKLQKASTYRLLSSISQISLCPILFLINHPIGSFISNTNFLFLLFQSHKLQKHKDNIQNLMKNIHDFFLHSSEYKDLEEIYLCFLYELLQFGNQYNIENPIEIFSMYYYFLQNGYLSIDHNFYFSKSSREEICMFYDLNIFEGKASCRNISPFLVNLLKLKGFDSYNASIYMNSDIYLNSFNSHDLNFDLNELSENQNSNLTISNVKKEERNEEEKLIDQNITPTTNHVITLVNEEHSSYYIDATNNTLYFIDEEYHLNPMNTKNKIKEVSFKSIFNHNKEYKSIPVIPSKQTAKESFDQYSRVFNICENSKNSIEFFYQEHKELYKEIIEKKKILYKKQGNFYEKTINLKINDYH